MAIETNIIKEIYKGHYSILLDFPMTDILYLLLSNSYKYVWGVNYAWCGCSWNPAPLTLFNKDVSGLDVRNVKMDFLLETDEFIKLIPFINGNLHLIQINNVPPYYLDLNRLKGKAKYDLLKKETDYLFEMELPYSPDYTQIVSPNVEFLKKFLLTIL